MRHIIRDARLLIRCYNLHMAAQWKPAIKIGPADFRKRLHDSGARHCEVWYRVDQKEKYAGLFSYTQEKGIATGLHFWGILEGNILPNIAYPDENIWKPSVKLIRQNIDDAAEYKSRYVNIHIGNAGLERMFFDEHRLEFVEGSEVSPDKAEHTFINNLKELQDYATQRKVLLIVETVPPMEAKNVQNRIDVHRNYALSSHVLEKICKELYIAMNNDFCHTAAECITNDREELWNFLYERTKALAPYTKLIHASTTTPPFNGTDSHNGMLKEDYEQKAFPSRDQLHRLLEPFQDRSDIWILSEPKEKHEENYKELEKLNKIF